MASDPSTWGTGQTSTGVCIQRSRNLKRVKIAQSTTRGKGKGLETGDGKKGGGPLFSFVIPNMASCEFLSASKVGSE